VCENHGVGGETEKHRAIVTDCVLKVVGVESSDRIASRRPMPY
jgi:hypothetical protein